MTTFARATRWLRRRLYCERKQHATPVVHASPGGGQLVVCLDCGHVLSWSSGHMTVGWAAPGGDS